MKLEFKELEIELGLDGLIQVEAFQLVQGLNDHAFLSIKFLVEEETSEEFVNLASVFPVIIREKVYTKGQIIFQGKAENVYTRVERGLSYLYFDAYSYSKEWERIEKSRSFLNGNMSYMDVARKVLSDYEKADIKDEITQNALIPELLLQYEESDWVFLRRLASHFGTYLIADCRDACGKVYFGIPYMNYGTELTNQDYSLEKDYLHYSKVLMPEGILPQESSQWKIKTRQFLFMGEELTINQIPAVVTEVDIVLEKGELVYRYTLSRRAGIRREKEINPRIYGMSIPATVKERSGNRVRVQFDIDKEYDPAGKFFTYAIESSSFYCMPEIGSRVHIYFPEHDEQSAIAVHAIGSGGPGGGQNPDNKRFSDPSGSAMDMTPETLCYVPDSGGSTMLYMTNAGQVSLRGFDINIKTQKGLMAGGETPPKNTFISGAQKVVLQIGDGGDDVITMEAGTDISSAMIEHTADSRPAAQPSGDELLKQVQEIVGNDEENRNAINGAVTQMLVDNKRASKQKFFNGVVSIATIIGGVALTIATGGTALAVVGPVLLAAAPKAAFAVADIAEGLDGYSKVNALDASKPSNFIRDNLMGGNQALYDKFSMAADILFDVVSGKAIKNGAKGLPKVLCSGSATSNMAAQVGGTVVFGAVNEYMVNGSVNWKNLLVYTGSGIIKGAAGNYLTDKVQAVVGSDSKIVNKAIGLTVNTTVGTAIDIKTNRILGVEYDPMQVFTQNLITSGVGQLFGEPIDAVSGAFLITATDFILSDIREPLRITRKYSSINKYSGLYGRGWKFLYEGRLGKYENKIHVDLDTGYHVIFEWENGKAKNITPGCGWYELEEDGDEWLLRDRKKKRVYHYGQTGLLLSITDQNSQTIRFEYHNDELDRIITALGYELKLTMRKGRLVQVTDGLGRTMQYRYENGLLSDVIHMDQGITHYEYDEQGYLTKAVDQAKVTYLENQYDNRGRVVLQTLANGDTYKAEYLDEERQVRVHSSIGKKTVLYCYGKECQILSMRFTDGTEIAYEYDEAGYRIQELNRLGQITSWRYDEIGRLISEQSASGLTTTYVYDEEDDLKEKTDNANRQTQYFYDGKHNLIEVKERVTGNGAAISRLYQYDRKGRLVQETDARGAVTTYIYGETCGKPAVVSYADGEEVRYEYDALGRQMALEDDCGRVEYAYNAKNYRTMVRDGEGNESHYMYDGMGRLLAMYMPKAWKTRKDEYVYKYDFLDRLIDTIRPDGSHQRQIRDGEGNILKNVHPNAYDALTDDGEGIRYEYDSDGNNIRIHYPDGGCERIFYDAEGKRTKHVMPEYYDPILDDGIGTSYEYDFAGRLAKIILPDGTVEAEYGYDLSGNILTKTDALGHTSYYAYDLRGNLTRSLVPSKKEQDEDLYQKVTFSYDGNGNKVKEHRFSGYWDKDGNLLRKDGTGLCLTYRYDCRNRLVQVEDGLGAVIKYRYDVRGNRIYEEKAINPEVRQIIHFVHDKAGRLIERREELDSGLEPVSGEYKTAVTTHGYDGNGNRIFTQTPEGYRITREYDTLDRLISERVEDRLNGIDRTVRVNYDKAGNITKLIRQGKDGMPWEISYSYDLKDRITHANDYFGPVFQYEYDKNDRLLKEALAGAELERSYAYTYDYHGNLVTETDSEGTLQEKHSYRADGKLAQSRFADGNELEYSYGINGLQQEIRTARSQRADRAAQVYTYDARGRITGIQDGNQNQTGYHMDPWGRVHQIETAEGGKENFTYDYTGHITSTTDANGGVITYRYNSQGKVCEIIDQEGNSETFRYDREGRRIFHEDRIGNQVRTTYNVDGRPVLERACDHMGENEVSRSWEYDGIGNVKKAVAGGFCYTYEYRPDGKLIKKSSSGRTLISCTYHADKSLKSLTDVSGKTVHYGYDSLGRLERICDDNGDEIVRYGHTAGGKLKEIRHGNGMHTIYEYDTDDNIIRLTLKNEEGIVFSDFRYEYDWNGNRVLKSGSSILPGEENIKEQVIRYQYDSMDRLIEEKYDGKPVKYIYDRCGNRLVKVDSDGKEEYNYNRKNQLISHKKGTESVEYRYDLQGNILEEVDGRGKTEYYYNAFNQQTFVLMKDGGAQENWYDAEFLRAEVAENGCRSRFLYYNGELLAESELNDTVRNRYILGYGVAASWQKEGYHSYHLDEQNSTAYITDSGRRIENSYQYDAFGVIREKNENVYNRILYTGQQYDQVTGQHYLRARYYNPVLGRFLQEDVYRGDGLNLYVYCENNSVIYYDPSGYGKAPVVPFKKGQYNYPDINALNYNERVRSLYGDPPDWMVDPHAHHFPYKKGKVNQQPTVDKIQDILVDFEIDPIYGEEVLCWAPNRVKGQHATAQLESYLKELEELKLNGGTREEVIELTRRYQQEDSVRGTEKEKKKNDSACENKN
ncbi:MAG: RHS repeat-associated core domain-containing protein [Hungatella hathewayi]|uniref:RHS repeat-associated core domain-containing protein n=1 Tax=Hungatella hathewayi TaxID=154046 RepID=UPI0026DC50B4|nr:RHS repeat-associated core domain-containing protein [Hungatella hathewayi]